MSDAQLLPKDDFKAQQKKLRGWAGGWADKQVVPWGRLQTDDYDFRSWAKDASNKLLNAGCLYEYARESHQFRCLLSTGFVDLSWSGWQCWLKDFTDQLVANKSFAELLRTSPIKVKESLDALVFQARCPIAS